MTFIVVGAAGFLGSALCARLERAGRDVRRVRRGEALPKAPGAVCVHVAGTSDAAAAAQPGALEEAEALARRLLAAGYARLVFSSSAHVYGDRSRSPRREDERPEPSSPYGRLKLAVEKLFPAPHAIARLSNVYGRGQSPLNVLSDVQRQLPGDGTVRLKGAADAVRDYLHIDDAAAGLAALAESEEAGLFNLSTGVGTSVTELAQLMGARRVEAGPPSGSYLVLDPAKARERLGWRAQMTLRDGLKTLVPSGRSS